MISMGSRSIMELTCNQKINGRISTEAEIVGKENALPQCRSQRYFIEGKWYEVEEIQSHQNNMSDILMKIYGKDSSTKRKNHIQVRYFFIQFHIENGYFSLKYCLTGEMYADL